MTFVLRTYKYVESLNPQTRMTIEIKNIVISIFYILCPARDDTAVRQKSGFLSIPRNTLPYSGTGLDGSVSRRDSQDRRFLSLDRV